MKRILTSALCIGFLSLGVGCDGGMSGLPESTAPGVPLDSIKADMKTQKGPLPKGSPTGEPEATTKKK
jgi:hypothetical protein